MEYEHLAAVLRKVAKADDGENTQMDGDERADDDSVIIQAASSYALRPENLAALTPTKCNVVMQPHFPPSSLKYQKHSDGEALGKLFCPKKIKKNLNVGMQRHKE